MTTSTYPRPAGGTADSPFTEPAVPPQDSPIARASVATRSRSRALRAVAPRWALRLGTVIALLALWQWLATADVDAWLRFDTVPSVTDVATAWWQRLHTRDYFLDIAQSVLRIGIGFTLATAIGVPVGIALGRSRTAGDTLGVLTELIRPIPAIAMVPIAILIFPTDEAGMVFITCAAALFPIIVSTRHAVRALPTIWEESIRTMGGTTRDVVLRVILPGITPGVFSGLSVGMGVAWICLISAEMISGRLGVGYRTWQSYTVVDYPGVVVGMFTIAALGVATSGAIELIGRRVTRWLPRGEDNR